MASSRRPLLGVGGQRDLSWPTPCEILAIDSSTVGFSALRAAETYPFVLAGLTNREV